jgi:nitroreductase
MPATTEVPATTDTPATIDLTEYKDAIDGALANRTPCVVATASARGEPNISLRGSTMVFDAQHLAYWDRVHGRQQEHVGENPHVVVFYRDPARRLSLRFYGRATVYAEGPIREQVMERVVEAELNRDPERTGVAVVVRVDLVMTLGNQVLQQRDGRPETPAHTLNLFEAMHTARSIRRFRTDPVPDALVQRVLDAAIQAPSGTNAQSWRFVVVRDPDLRRQLGELYRQGFREVYAPDRAANETDPNRRRVIRSADYLAEHMGSEPPVLVLACIERSPNSTGATHTAGSSIFPAVQNLLLAARALGLGGCLTTLHLRREAQVKALLGIPSHVDTYTLIPLGYPASPHGPLRRRPVAEITHYDGWRG